MKPISILIITYNRSDDLLCLLKNLYLQEDYEVLVEELLILNNASTGSYTAVEDFLSTNKKLSTQFINSKENLGVARGRNYLIRIAKAPYLLILDDDVLFERISAIKTLASLFNKKQYVLNNTAVLTLNI